MTTLELKKNFHSLIDDINNENLLMKFYELLFRKKESHDGMLWNKLSRKEQEELLSADEESKNIMNLISHDEMKKKHKKWLSK